MLLVRIMCISWLPLVQVNNALVQLLMYLLIMFHPKISNQSTRLLLLTEIFAARISWISCFVGLLLSFFLQDVSNNSRRCWLYFSAQSLLLTFLSVDNRIYLLWAPYWTGVYYEFLPKIKSSLRRKYLISQTLLFQNETKDLRKMNAVKCETS